MPHLLILDQDDVIRNTLSSVARDNGYSVDEAASSAEAISQMHCRPPHLVLADLRASNGEGIDVCRTASAAGTEVVVMSERRSVDDAVHAIRLGARDFLPKPICLTHLRTLLSEVAQTSSLVGNDLRPYGMVGESPAMEVVARHISRVSPSDVTVMLIGESGTGKEVAAHAIHAASKRADKPFVAVNCGAISPNLIESELFGHERGSFTGAERQHRGYFEQADGGTLFLDEVTEMPLELQVKLLRVLENAEYKRVGGQKAHYCNVRVIAATNRDPLSAIRDGALREDLYYRLAVFPLSLPPLRERGADIGVLAEHFLAELNARHGTQRTFSHETLQELEKYEWPGNVRELRNYVQRAYILANNESLCAPIVPPMFAASGQCDDAYISVRMNASLEEAERECILATLAHCGGKRQESAELLGISTKTLYNRLAAYAEQGYCVSPQPF